MIGRFISKSEAIKRTAYFIFVLSAFAAMPSMNTGEGAEEIVEKLGTDHHLIHKHEELAETLALLCYILGVISLVEL